MKKLFTIKHTVGMYIEKDLFHKKFATLCELIH